ncbi:interleukin-1 receptor type 1-like isoform X1 [Alosa pseudoharengus]|uniref:interleukin-1 receptor type 1-like isoform X1 n=2 Tax=Alosa pseudoharengus TaxID=34774 RepID=UPI003F8C3139
MARSWRGGPEHVLVVGLLMLLRSHVLTGEKIFNIVAGHAMRLACPGAPGYNVTWRREDAPPLDALPGAELRDNALWFLPARPEHSGVYVCSVEYAIKIRLNVGSQPCPEADRDVDERLHTHAWLDCAMGHISRVFTPTSITWMKECKRLERADSMELEFLQLKQTDAGNYTCVLNFTYEGNNYTSARTTQLILQEIYEPKKPLIKVPGNETRVVDMGSRQDLRCEATSDEEDVTNIWWQVNETVILYPDSDFNISKVDFRKTYVNTLTIYKVQPKFLNVPFVCTAQNNMGDVKSTVVLVQANHRHFYWLIALVCLSGLVMVCLLLCWFFKVDLVLFYRSHCIGRPKHSDGKQYDAYVSYPCEGQGDSMALTFALRVLPEVLENKHGYKLFIRGRDDNPGDEVFDVIEDALKRSRRFIIVLDETQTDTNTGAETKTNTHVQTATHTETRISLLAQPATRTDTPMLLDTHTLADAHLVPRAAGSEHFEWSVGVYEALICSGPKVIIVQTGESSTGNSLPLSLQTHTHSKRTLRWTKHTQAYSNRRFWKELRYLMPVAQRPSHNTSSA